MKRVDDTPIDPEIAASLDAIDATLEGRAVDPQYAELAELALLLTAERPACRPEFATAMDARVERRFGPAPSTAAGGGTRRRWSISPVWGTGIAAALGAIVVAVVLASSGSGPGIRNGVVASASSSAAAGASSGPGVAAASGSRHGATSSHALARTRSTAGGPASSWSGSALSSAAKSPPSSGTVTSSSASTTTTPSGAYAPALHAGSPSTTSAGQNSTPVPLASGRKVVQSGQLALNAPSSKIDAVAQEVFDVVSAENGFVNHSSVTANGTPSAYASFELSIPSGNLQAAMNELSRLQYATVSSRSDQSQDVTGQYNSDARRINEAKAARTALLKQLAAATTTAQVDSLQAQIHNEDAQITADQSALNALAHQVNYSLVSVTINGTSSAAPVSHGGFNLPAAFRDAGRVLTVAAGVALVGLSGLVPLALIIAIGWWVTTSVRRHRRDHALDLA